MKIELTRSEQQRVDVYTELKDAERRGEPVLRMR